METPRAYQEELFNIAKKENIICVAPTGSGKTLIAALLINYRLELLQDANQKKVLVFVVPTRVLATQQSEYIARRILSKNCKKVKSYTSQTTSKDGINVESWKESNWLEESNDSMVMVMTAGVLLGILRKSLLPPRLFDFFIFDECHHARGDSPMASVSRIIKSWESPPRIMGLTASPVVGNKESLSTIKELEDTLQCRLVFADELDQQLHLPTCSVVKYSDENRPPNDKVSMSKVNFVVNFKELTKSFNSFDLFEDTVYVLWQAILRMYGVIDILSIYKILRTISSQPTDFHFLLRLNLPLRQSETNVSDYSISKFRAFRVEDNIGNHTFNVVKEIGAKIRQVLSTSEECGVILAMYTFQSSLNENLAIDDLTDAHKQLMEDLNSKDIKNFVVGCIETTVDVKVFENTASNLLDAPFQIKDLFEAETNTCLSLLDTYFVLVCSMSYQVRHQAIDILENSINQNMIVKEEVEDHEIDKEDNDNEEDEEENKAHNKEGYIHTNEILQIIVNILKCIENTLTKEKSVLIEIGSFGVISLLGSDYIEIMRRLRIDQLKIALFEACSAILKSVDTEAILRTIFNPTLPSIRYQLSSEYSEEVLHKNSQQKSLNYSKEKPFQIITSKVTTLCRVLYDDPARRHEVVLKSLYNQLLIDKKNESNSIVENVEVYTDRECVTIVFCTIRLVAMALNEFLKHFSPERFQFDRFVENQDEGEEEEIVSVENIQSITLNNINSVPITIENDYDLSDERKRKRNYHLHRQKQQLSTSLSSQCLIGGSSQTRQDRILKKFKSGLTNILIATDVAEEGVDVRACRLVVNFDVPTSLKSYVQRRGRARAKNSHMVTLVSDNIIFGRKTITNLLKIEKDEENLQEFKDDKILHSLYIESKSLIYSKIVSEHEQYEVMTTGAKATINTAIEILNQYCSILISNGYFSSDVIYWIETREMILNNEIIPNPQFQCYILLPAFVPASIRCLSGPLVENKSKAKSLAALECIKQLHSVGELNDHLVATKGIFSTNKLGFKFSSVAVKETKDEHDENNENNEIEVEEIIEPMNYKNITSEHFFDTCNVQSKINVSIKIVPDLISVKNQQYIGEKKKEIEETEETEENYDDNKMKKINTITNMKVNMMMMKTSDMKIMDSNSKEVYDYQEISHSSDKIYFYRSSCIGADEAISENIKSCSGCSLHYRALNDICIGFRKKLPIELIESIFPLALRERETVLVKLKFVYEKYVSSEDLIQLQRFHQAILCWQCDSTPLDSHEWFSYEEYVNISDNHEYKCLNDEEWVSSSEGMWYVLCPLPLELTKDHKNSNNNQKNYDEIQVDLDILHSPEKWSSFLRKCANEAQLLVHNLSVQEKLKYISLSKIKARGKANWPRFDKKDHSFVDEQISREMVSEYLITRGRYRLSVGLLDNPDNFIEIAKQKRVNTESDDDDGDDDEEDTGNSKGNNNSHNYHFHNLEDSGKIMLLQVSSNLTLVPLLGNKLGNVLSRVSHSHNDKLVTSVSKCGLLGKKRWFFIGLCAPTIIWRIQSLLLAYECRNYVDNLLKAVNQDQDQESSNDSNDSNIIMPKLDLFHEALTPRMCDEPSHNERIEVIGDSVLKLITTMELFRLYPTQQEGFLSQARETVISNAHLSHMAKVLDISKYIRALSLSSGKQKLRFRPPGINLEGWNNGLCLWNTHVITKETIEFKEPKIYINTNMITTVNTGINTNVDVDTSMSFKSVIKRPSIQNPIESFKNQLDHFGCVIVKIKKKMLADLVESIIGVYYLSGGIEQARYAIKGLRAWPTLSNVMEVTETSNSISLSTEMKNDVEFISPYDLRGKDMILSKNMKFIPVSLNDIPDGFPESMRKIALGIVPLPQSTINDESIHKYYNTSNLTKNDNQSNNSNHPCASSRIFLSKNKKLTQAAIKVTSLVMSLPSTTVGSIEIIFGYRFHDIKLLQESLTHSTASAMKNNQRLEFFGDAVLDFAVISLLYQHQSRANEGELSIQKSNATNNVTLGKLSVGLGLHKYLMVHSIKLADDFNYIEAALQQEQYEKQRYGSDEVNNSEDKKKGEEVDKDNDNKEEDYENEDNESKNDKEEGKDTDEDNNEKKEDVYDKILRKKPAAVKALADALEAIIGAIFIDSNYSLETIQKIIYKIDMLPQLNIHSMK